MTNNFYHFHELIHEGKLIRREEQTIKTKYRIFGDDYTGAIEDYTDLLARHIEWKDELEKCKKMLAKGVLYSD